VTEFRRVFVSIFGFVIGVCGQGWFKGEKYEFFVYEKRTRWDPSTDF
jgi:hypothetical protein